MPGVVWLAAALWLQAAPPRAELPVDVDVSRGFSVPKATGLEERLLKEAAAGALGTVDFVDGALLASGVREAQLPQWRARLGAALEPLRNRARAGKGQAQRGRLLLSALHETLLTRYVADASSLPRVLDTGEFNCLSSAVLYVMAAQGLLDQPRAMVSLVHAFARVTVDGRAVDVETTLPQGFDPNRATLFTPATLERLGLVDASGARVDMAQQGNQAVELPPVALLAGLYSNRAVEHLQQGDVAAAAVALDRGTQLAQGPQKERLTAWRGALMANASRALLLQGRARDAVPLLQLGLPGSVGVTRTVLLHNLAVAWQQLAQEALTREEAQEALRFVDQAESAEPGQPSTRDLRNAALSRKAAQQADPGGCAPIEDAHGKAECLAATSAAQLHKGQLQDAVTTARASLAAETAGANARICTWNALNARALERARAGRCADAQADWTEAEALRDLAPQAQTVAQKVASCWGQLAQAAGTRQDWADARAGWERVLLFTPLDPVAQQNLAAAATNQAIALANTGRCDDARPLVSAAARAWPAGADKGRQVMVSCAHARASDAFGRKDWRQAALEARRGLRDAPGSKDLTALLAGALYNQARDHVVAHECDAARPLADEVAALGDSPHAAALKAACPAP
jgi:hypothetical protein